jgi:hypothetical protein
LLACLTFGIEAVLGGIRSGGSMMRASGIAESARQAALML